MAVIADRALEKDDRIQQLLPRLASPSVIIIILLLSQTKQSTAQFYTTFHVLPLPASLWRRRSRLLAIDRHHRRR